MPHCNMKIIAVSSLQYKNYCSQLRKGVLSYILKSENKRHKNTVSHNTISTTNL